ncbi:MAG: helix-turn-helix domain-containing protein, partial [Myxococcota bacterium]
RKALIAAAVEVFSARGISNSKVADIVKAAGVAQGTFYVHFRTKGDVVDYVVRSFNHNHGTMLVKEAVRHLRHGAHAVIAAQSRAHIQMWRDHAKLFPLFVDHFARHSRDEPLLIRDVADVVAAFAEEVTRSGSVERRVPSREIARIIVTLWRQSGLHVARDQELSVDDAARTLELSTVAIYDALAPGLTAITPKGLAAAYRNIVTAHNKRAAKRKRAVAPVSGG